jgi:hypothetical protein
MCDALPYAVLHLRDHDYSDSEVVEVGYPPRGYGAIMGHQQVWDDIHAGRAERMAMAAMEEAERQHKADRRGWFGIRLPARRAWPRWTACAACPDSPHATNSMVIPLSGYDRVQGSSDVWAMPRRDEIWIGARTNGCASRGLASS